MPTATPLAFERPAVKDSHAEALPVGLSHVRINAQITAVHQGRLDPEALQHTLYSLEERCVSLMTELLMLSSKLRDQETEMKWLRKDGVEKKRGLEELTGLYEEQRGRGDRYARRIGALERDKAAADERIHQLVKDNQRLVRAYRRAKENRPPRPVSPEASHVGTVIFEGAGSSVSPSRSPFMSPRSWRYKKRTDEAEARVQELMQELDDAQNAGGDRVRELEEANRELQRACEQCQGSAEQSRRAAQELQAKGQGELDRALQEVTKASNQARAAEERAKAAEDRGDELARKLLLRNSGYGSYMSQANEFRRQLEAQAKALQATRQELTEEKVKRLDAERVLRLERMSRQVNPVRGVEVHFSPSPRRRSAPEPSGHPQAPPDTPRTKPPTPLAPTSIANSIPLRPSARTMASGRRSAAKPVPRGK